MKLFALDPYRALGEGIASGIDGRSVETAEWSRFKNGELKVSLDTEVSGYPCMVLGTVEPPEINLACFLLLCDTLRRNGAVRVEAVLPYLAYSRQDRPEPNRSLAAAWLGELMKASGVGAVHTIDVHSQGAVRLFPIPVNSICPARLFAAALPECLAPGWTLVAPDSGAIPRCKRLGQALGGQMRTVHFEKSRTEGGIASKLVGYVSESALVVDDILDTGETLIACCKGLRDAGTRKILVAVTHGLFTGSAWEALWGLGVSQILCTDSVLPVRSSDPRIRVLSCSPLLAEGCGVKERDHVEA